MTRWLRIFLAIAFLLGGGTELQLPAAPAHACCGMAMDDGCPCPAPNPTQGDAPCGTVAVQVAIQTESTEGAEASVDAKAPRTETWASRSVARVKAVPAFEPRAPETGARLALLERWRI